jgi:molybdate transport system substrate-binding protein
MMAGVRVLSGLFATGGRAAVLALVTIILLAAAISNPKAKEKTGVLIFAAASTADAINDVLAHYARRPDAQSNGPDAQHKTGESRPRVRASFASSGTLARQISLGAPAHIFLSANAKWMDYLARQKLIVNRSRRNLFGNRLVLIAPSRSRITLTIAPDFPLARALGSGRLVVADPGHVPAGIYARQALKSLGVWDTIARRIARAGNVRAALALVARGEAPLGIVYATDAGISPGVKRIATFPSSSHGPITYPAALMAGRDTKAARRFYDFLISRAGLGIFARHGFEVE